MKQIDDKSIDLILCDLPYGIVQQKWDCVIPFEDLWNQYKRIIKDKGNIVLTAGQPFTSALVMSQPKLFRYEWIWKKNISSNFGNVKRQPLKQHESVLVFYKKMGTYNPQGLIEFDEPKKLSNKNKNGRLGHIQGCKNQDHYYQTHTNYPKSILEFNCEKGIHPTQKPVSLFEYLIRTYSNEGDLVLDNCAGSSTTGIACINAKRNYILMEKDYSYYQLGVQRLQDHQLPFDKVVSQ